MLGREREVVVTEQRDRSVGSLENLLRGEILLRSRRFFEALLSDVIK